MKGAHITHAQLSEQWLLHSHRILQSPFSGDAYTNLLKEAEQFLWAGSEMDSVSYEPNLFHSCIALPFLHIMILIAEVITFPSNVI